MELVLGSTSPFRKALLQRLGLPFAIDRPGIDETALPGEAPADLVRRLSLAKARAVADRHPGALVIGSDQVASRDGTILGKPGTRERAIEQLAAASGRALTFYTGLCLLNARTGASEVAVETFVVRFRDLDAGQIARYVDRERPLDCAGSFRAEGLGITLFRGLEGRDPSSLIGLPLILLVEMLERQGVRLP